MAASKGLGKATALEYAKEGATVFISSRNESELITAVDEIHSKVDKTKCFIKYVILPDLGILKRCSRSS